jgi:hypothetical protein
MEAAAMERLAEWSDARSAAIFLKPCTPKHLNEELGQYLTRKSGNVFNQTHARSGGWQYHKHDLERVRAIMDALGCRALKAAWLFHAIKELGRRGALPHLTEELKTTVNREAAKRRRFQ